jgi:hypothetical protein
VRAIIDTNLLVSGLFWHGNPHALLEHVRAGTAPLGPPCAGLRIAQASHPGVQAMSVHHSRHIARAFGAVLKRARTGAGLSQETLAERAELDRTTPSL